MRRYHQSGERADPYEFRQIPIAQASDGIGWALAATDLSGVYGNLSHGWRVRGPGRARRPNPRC